MKLDDKCQKSFELFLHFWTAKVQDLKGIEDKLVEDDTMRICLTNTLSSQPDMDAAIRTQGSHAAMSIPWINVYNMVFLIPSFLTPLALSH
jgi:hypothetical protein